MCDESTNFLTEIYFIYDMNFKPTIQQIHQENCPEIFYFNFTDETKLAVWEKYDYYAFAVQYSPNVCVWRGDNCFKILKNKTDYKVGIHGLWPSYKSGIIPQQCNLGEDIQIEVDSDREYFDNFILKYWYSLYNTDDYFLTHEYNTHGYCYNKYINESTDNFEWYPDARHRSVLPDQPRADISGTRVRCGHSHGDQRDHTYSGISRWKRASQQGR